MNGMLFTLLLVALGISIDAYGAGLTLVTKKDSGLCIWLAATIPESGGGR
jgi:hypothetical protein